jgi:hypothetical protein
VHDGRPLAKACYPRSWSIIGTDLDGTASQTWVANAPLLMQAVLSPLIASISDLFQSRKDCSSSCARSRASVQLSRPVPIISVVLSAPKHVERTEGYSVIDLLGSSRIYLQLPRVCTTQESLNLVILQPFGCTISWGSTNRDNSNGTNCQSVQAA